MKRLMIGKRAFLFWTTDEMIVVSHDLNTSYGVLSIYAIGTGTPPTPGFPTFANCMGDPDNGRAFVAQQVADVVVDVDTVNFALSGASFAANYNPTEIVYYDGGTEHKLAMILTNPVPMIRTVEVGE